MWGSVYHHLKNVLDMKFVWIHVVFSISRGRDFTSVFWIWVDDLMIAEHSWSIRRFTCGSSGLYTCFFFSTQGGLEQSLLHRSKPSGASFKKGRLKYPHHHVCFQHFSIIQRPIKGREILDLFEVFTFWVVEKNLSPNRCKYFTVKRDS